MRKFMAIVFLLIPGLFFGYDLIIDRFSADIEIDSSATVSVTEDFEVSFMTSMHGIYRTIPFKSVVNGKNYRVRLYDFDSDWQMKKTIQGDMVNLRLGDPDSYVSGRQTYQISYKAQRVLLTDDEDYDEFYWNLSGNEWEIPIRAFSATITFPEDVTPGDNLEYRVYAGQYGSDSLVATSTDEETVTQSGQRGSQRGPAVVPATVSFSGNQMTIDYPGTLDPGMGLTAQIIFTKGMVEVPFSQKLWGFIYDYWYIFVTVVFLFVSLLIWAKWGKDEKVAIMTEFFPPEGVSPSDADSVLKQMASFDIASTIVDLAVRGYLVIGSDDRKKTYVEQPETLPPENDLRPYEQELLRRLFSAKYIHSEHQRRVYTSSLKDQFYRDYEVIVQRYNADFNKKGFFEMAGNAWRGFYGFLIAVSIGLIVLGFVVLGNNKLGLLGLLTIVPNIIFFIIMPRKTRAGLEVYMKTKGFKEFVGRAEKERIKQLFEENRDYFDATIPFAIIFGLADRWGGAFDGLMMEPPHWYHSPHYMRGGGFRVSSFAHSLNRDVRSVGQQAVSRPQSSGGGGGFSGGGFSGGGFGGGGGGGW